MILYPLIFCGTIYIFFKKGLKIDWHLKTLTNLAYKIPEKSLTFWLKALIHWKYIFCFSYVVDWKIYSKW